MFDSKLAEKFHKHLSTLTDEQIFSRANRAPPCGMEPIIYDYSILTPFIKNVTSIIDDADYLTREQLDLLIKRIADDKDR